jgi:hypothetical protein
MGQNVESHCFQRLENQQWAVFEKRETYEMNPTVTMLPAWKQFLVVEPWTLRRTLQC